ncbi:hypothetical protein GYB22_01200 [bacterium]|nr:hypothetical protein [bacterium]
MSISFLCVLPVIIGFVTIFFSFLQNRYRKISRTMAFVRPALVSLVLLTVTIFLSMEGAVCWIMIFPLFLLMAWMGGAIARSFFNKKIKIKDHEIDDIGKYQIIVLLALPFILGPLEGDRLLFKRDMSIDQKIVINASPEVVWSQIIKTDTFYAIEKDMPVIEFMGFPKHQYTVLDSAKVGGQRLLVYDKGLYFEETIKEIIPNEKLILDLYVDPKKVPPTVMDEHIVIGGKYLDLLTDEYHLNMTPKGKTEVLLKSNFWIRTPFNWYTQFWAKLMMNDLLQGELEQLKASVEDEQD